MITNKATSFDLALTTPGGTQFTLDIRMGGVFWSEARIKARLGQGQHRDVKSPNVLISRDWVGKIGDFGLSERSRNSHRPSSGAAHIGDTSTSASE